MLAAALLNAFVDFAEHFVAVDNLPRLSLEPSSLDLLAPFQTDLVVVLERPENRKTAMVRHEETFVARKEAGTSKRGLKRAGKVRIHEVCSTHDDPTSLAFGITWV